jgi:A/G-specific adenine glycosylase
MLLIQTKAEDVAKVWPVLIKRYPSAERLARARTRTLTRLLHPLGLQNQRARALKALSRAIVDRFDGVLPQSMTELLSLPYVGLYVASAVACFSYGQRVPIVDANVLRVVGRITGIQSGRELRRCPKVWEIAWGIIPRNNFVLHNYGVLDFAAEVCKARVPLCSSCPLNTNCVYGRRTNVGAAARPMTE